jgi:hypothetical protein
MTKANSPPGRSPRLQFSLRALLGLTLLVGAYCGGFATSQGLDQVALRQAREEAARAQRAEQDAQQAVQEAERTATARIWQERKRLAAQQQMLSDYYAASGIAPGAAVRAAIKAVGKSEPVELLPPPRIRVYVMSYGKVYHHWDGIRECRYLYEQNGFFGGIEMDLEEAEHAGYRPCKVCRPDK